MYPTEEQIVTLASTSIRIPARRPKSFHRHPDEPTLHDQPTEPPRSDPRGAFLLRGISQRQLYRAGGRRWC
jgi:hypothetical protein